MAARLMAIIAEGPQGRVYFAPTAEHEAIAASAIAEWKPDLRFAHNSRHLTPWVYGFDNFGSLFTQRQHVVLSSLTDLVNEVREKVRTDANSSSSISDEESLDDDGVGARAYSEAISLYVAFLVSQVANHSLAAK